MKANDQRSLTSETVYETPNLERLVKSAYNMNQMHKYCTSIFSNTKLVELEVKPNNLEASTTTFEYFFVGARLQVRENK